MSTVSEDSSSNYEEEEDIAVKIEEQSENLEVIFAKIDELQDENDSLQGQLADIRCEFDSFNRKNNIAMRTTKRMQQERQSKGSAPINRSLLSEEHQQYISEKENRINMLTQQLDQLQKSYETQEIELDAITEENDDIALENTRIEKEIHKTYVESKNISQATSLKRAQISEQKAELSEVRKRIEESQETMRNIIFRIEDGEYDDKKLTVLCREIDTISADVENYSLKIEQTKNDLNTMIEDEEAEEERISKEREEKRAIIGWDEERATLQNEYKTVIEDEKKVSDDLKKASRHNNLLRKRLSKLEPVYKKWNSRFRGKSANENIEANIDSLLKELDEKNMKASRSEAKGGKKSKDEAVELKKIIAENQALEQKITKKRRMMDNSLKLFKGEEVSMKQTISQLRSAAFEKEQQLVEEIKALQIKGAGRF